MRCNYKKEDIEKYSEGTLSANSAEKIKKHIKSCKECASYYRLYLLLMQFLKIK